MTNQNPSYTGRTLMYMYPWKNGKGYYINIFDIVPTDDHLKKNHGNISLKKFDGLICLWNLQTGFVGGTKYENSIANPTVQITYSSAENNSQNNLQNTSNHNLKPMICLASYPAPAIDWGLYWSSVLYYFIGVNTNTILDNGGTIPNPCEYSGCIDSNTPDKAFDETILNQILNDMFDEDWAAHKVLDSTNNPCVSDVLQKLSTIDGKLPTLIRTFFGSNPSFSITIKMSNNSTWGVNGTPPSGAYTEGNITGDNFKVFINSYYNDATDLATAATIIHEALHCQLMYWYKKAVLDNDTVTQNQLANDYGFIFTSTFNENTNLMNIINGGNPTQHQVMANFYNDLVANAILAFAQSKGIPINLSYCKDLAWAGTFDSNSFIGLSYSDQERIKDRVSAEKDPSGTKSDPSGAYTINGNQSSPKGTPCP
jgi:hypothetical protein